MFVESKNQGNKNNNGIDSKPLLITCYVQVLCQVTHMTEIACSTQEGSFSLCQSRMKRLPEVLRIALLIPYKKLSV